MKDLLKGYPVITEIPVAWGEMDALNHVNNVVYFRYLETARIEYFREVALMEEIQHTGIGPVLGETSCRYKLPVTYPDTLYVGSRVSELKEDRFTMEYEIVSKKLGAVTTSGTAKVVMFNFKTNKKAILSPSLVEAIESIESRVSTEQVTVE
ncbi:acyl-CoA thioesterase [Photobacterium alginatilyticum]|uniref:Acyl-CoA thioesterase n=1 Tax=Photobacterium alginatilyticum TaxID=1775171 RepID=A0ABW9YQD5_9GAMM|nr:thioesterase family protein [Photobacterium alginatilyticum]NBI55904.1 acyl-CoA thioesterase [Photobacterium alginatilyticum]